jgi:hypothetical protein
MQLKALTWQLPRGTVPGHDASWGDHCGSPEWEVQMEKEIYEAPQLRELGEVHALTEGSEGDAPDGTHLLVTPPPPPS